jgi:valyl-tRNA synthetase
VIPFATEEAWSWSEEGSVHLAAWPTSAEVAGAWAAHRSVLSVVGRALTGVRGAKTAAKASQRTPVDAAVIAGPADEIAALELAAGDLRSVGRIADLRFASADELTVTDILLAQAPTEEDR